MLALDMLLDIVLEPAGVPAVDTLPPSILAAPHHFVEDGPGVTCFTIENVAAVSAAVGRVMRLH